MIGLFNGSPVISFGQVDPARPPVVVTGGTQLLVVSPRDRWTLFVEAKGDLVNGGDPETKIPISRLAWAVNDGNPPRWTQLQACTPQTVCGPADPTDEKGQVIRIDYRLSPSWDDPPLPWEYTAELCFTLSPDLEPLHSWVYPTPFTPGGGELLTIGYWLPGSGPLPVEVRITDAAGTVVKVLADTQEGGKWHEVSWDGRTAVAAEGGYEFVRAGVYYYQVILLTTNETIAAGIIEVAHHRYAGKSRVCGRIVRADTGEGLAGAHVVLYTRERRQAAGGITDMDGNYRLDHLPAGDYYLEASLPGYLAAVSELFYLDGHGEREISLKLFPNRALDLDLQLSTRSLAVGELVGISLRVTNSGTRDLLAAAAEVILPPGFTWVGSKAEVGRTERGEAFGGQTSVKWEIGSLRQGESRQLELWVLAGLDVCPGMSVVEALAVGFTATEKLDGGRVSRPVEITSGRFTAASPRSTVDAHVSLPLGGSASLELELKPDPAAAYPPPPLRTEVKKEKEQRNPLVPISEPLAVNIGELPPHRLRVRVEGDGWAVEGGSWRHFLPAGRLPIDELTVAGVSGAVKNGDVVFRSFYGVPETWPYFRLIPADNTSGPFPLPKTLSGSGTIDVKVLSWDERRGVWQEEAPVLYRVDYSRGTITLGRAVSSHNPRGDRQYVLITHTHFGLQEDAVWKEAGVAVTKDKVVFFGSLMEVGEKGSELQLAGLRGRFVDRCFVLQGSWQTVLRNGLTALEKSLLPKSGKEKPLGKSIASRSAWQLIGAVEIYPGLRIGGGWGEEGSEYMGFWGLTGGEEGAPLAESRLAGLVNNLWHQLASTQARVQEGQGPLISGKGGTRRWALGLEADLAESWRTSFTAKREELAGESNNTAGSGSGGFYEPAGQIFTQWEQRLTYEAEGLPRLSLGYGHKAAESLAREKSRYGLLEAEGTVAKLQWRGQISLIQDLSGGGGDRGREGEQPIQAVAELSAKYGGERFQPHITGRLGKSVIGGASPTQRDFEEWSIGLDGKLNDHLVVSIVHTDRYQFCDKSRPPQETDIIPSSAAVEKASSDKGSSTDIDSYSQAVALSARYSKGESWSLTGTGEWTRSDGGGFQRQGSLELETSLGCNFALQLCWSGGEEFLPFQAETQWVDRFTLTLRQEEPDGLWTNRQVLVGTSLKGAKALAWEAAAEGALHLKPWEVWSRAVVKSVSNPLVGQLVTKQGILRLSRQLKEHLAGFVQLGAWQQLEKAELSCSLGVSWEVVPGISIAAGYTWPLFWEGWESGYLSVRPGLFAQLFAR